jgi:hypothetical protein
MPHTVDGDTNEKPSAYCLLSVLVIKKSKNRIKAARDDHIQQSGI